MAVSPIHAQFGNGSGLSTTLAILGFDGGFGLWGDSDANENVPDASPVGAGVIGTCSVRSGVVGISRMSTGVYAMSTQGSGVYATSARSFGLYGETGGQAYASAVYGRSGSATGVTGRAIGVGSGPGVVGWSDDSFGVRGQSGSADLLPPVGGGPQFKRCGVQGSSDDGTGVRGDSANRIGVRGRSFHGDGVFGSCHDQFRGPPTKGNGIHGMAPRPAADANTGPFAGRFDGDVTITGRLFLNGRILRRARSRLIRRSRTIEMQDVIAGVANLDAKGKAEVSLPKEIADSYGDVTYQLTSIGGAAPNLHIAAQIRGGKFKIAGGVSRGRVSWQITGTFNGEPEAPKKIADAPADKREIRKYRQQSKDNDRRVGDAVNAAQASSRASRRRR